MTTERKSLLERLPPQHRQRAIIGIVVGGVVGLILALVMISDDGELPARRATAPEDVGNVLVREDPRELGLSGVANELSDMEGRLDELERENARLRDQAQRGGGASPPGLPAVVDPDEELRALSQGVDRAVDSAPPGTIYNPDAPSMPARDPRDRPPASERGREAEAAAAAGAQAPSYAAPTIQTITQADTPAADLPPAFAPPPVYLPTGSMITGTLLNGLDAPTGRAAQNAPIPVVIRIKREAILPSQQSSDVREAFVLASGYGDLSSERAYLRAERLSMILRNGKVIDIPIKMAAVGSDSKAGLRGRVVSKQGAVIAKALMAGTADGISRAFSNSYSLGSSGGGEADAGQIGMAGLSGGTSTALDRVAAYFLQQAESMYPIIEVDGGREVTLLLLEGVELSTRDTQANATAQSPPEGR